MSGVTKIEDVEKPADDGDALINIKVNGQEGIEVLFRTKRSTKLKKLMNSYCERIGVELLSRAFLFDGTQVKADQTPAELEMQDGDEIDAMLHADGGAAI